MTVNQHTVTETEHKKRVDKILADVLHEYSRSQIQGWIEEGNVKLNGEAVKANQKCQTGESLTWEIPETKPLVLEPENIPLDIVYEDEDLLVVNKAKGMVVHPSAGHHTGTLVHALLYHCTDLSGINGVERPGIVHRLDMDTSGLLVVAKNDYAHQYLSEQLQEKTLKRTYEAIVHGEIGHETGLIDAPIGRDPKDRQKMGIVENGKQAVTHFRVLERFPDYTHVECQLETGRTHQIRVHMQYIGFPIVGDPKYGQRKSLDVQGQALHAKQIAFIHPRTEQQMEFEATPPDVFMEALDQIRKMY
ncbi:Ribosomal large subunit pseudouridine synthase D [Oceanobacillus oncorhynchi]|uniref:Pseudouridine synthase n=1 Tax=Oceanobacillus oncorhynchi TaxID=545501 RepID=A0A0A1MG61_9BACI|nr:RluA family pseudouridine synthase [Oceanobacillus oncorhynchi]CEI84370.1 Ribosomal large subunit pseudouridine synthase D [Oceanobacillus oncorhynchi]